MPKTLACAALVVAVFLIVTPCLQAQDFQKLLEAVDRIEQNLKTLVNEEAATRTKDVKALKQEIADLKSGTATGAPVPDATATSLQKQIDELKATLATLSSNPSVGGSDTQAMIAEIAQLKSETQYLRGLVEKNAKQLASLDDADAMSLAKPADDQQLAQLTERIGTLNTEVEKYIGERKNENKNRPTVNKGDVVFSGLLHEQFYTSQDQTQRSTFDTKRVRFGAKGTINQYAKAEIVGEFAKSVKLLEGYLSLSPNPHWALTVGQFRPSFGADFNRGAAVMMFVTQALGTPLGPDRDVGANVGFTTPVSKDVVIVANTGVFNGSGINVADKNSDKNIASRFEVQARKVWTAGVNTYFGQSNDTGVSRQTIKTYGGSLNYTQGPNTVEGEYIFSTVGTTHKQGWYLWAGHSFVTKSKVIPEIQPMVRYEQYDKDVNVVNNRADRLTIGANLYIDKKFTKMQFNYQFNREQGTKLSNDEFLMNLQVAF